MKIGLTGGIGCGKSTALGIFAERGCATVSTDALVRGLLQGDAETQRALAQRFGQTVVSLDNTVDRRALARIVFQNQEHLAWLESLLHPKVRQSWLAKCEEAPDRLWFVEIPLLFEKELESLFDFTICLAASPEITLARLERRGISAEDAKRRMQRQLPLLTKMERSDFVLWNDGSTESLALQADDLLSRLGAATDGGSLNS